MAEDTSEDPFDLLSREARDLYLTEHITRVPVPSPLAFYRDYVSANKPVIFTGATQHWGAHHKWSNAYLKEQLSDVEVTVDFTPEGHGDTVRDGVFVTPVEKRLPFGAFVDILEGNFVFCSFSQKPIF
jgi:hypothetical protein